MNIKCIFYDFDGVMTDNKVILSENGEESVIVNRSDGLAISYFKKLDIHQYIISSEQNPVVTKRANKLNIHVFQGISNKVDKIKDIIKQHKLKIEEVVFIGNDLNDLDVMNYLDNTFCPLDSHPKILNTANKVLDRNGGDGVIMCLYNYLGESN
jgi:YrbI family 3-deoxy-D-manno-octulosonate 8-phosphate phosphatase